MSFQKSTTTLKEEVLTIAGELTDGSSEFEDKTVGYLDDVFQGLLSGGNVFGFDVGEPWVWAQAKRPIVMSLLPAESGAATLTQGLTSGTFSVAPSISLVGRYFRVESRSDIYRIVTHTAGDTAFKLDQPYLQDGGTLNYMAFKLDYDVIDDTIIIDSSNNKLEFREISSVTLTATITVGTYTPTALAAEIETRMEAAGAQAYTVSFNTLTRKFTLAQGGAYFDLVFASGSNVETSISNTIGFDIEDQQSALTYTSGYALNGVMRTTKPITMYREAPAYYNSAKDAGKIFQIDDNTFLREHPLNRLIQDVPDRFCVVNQTPTGLWTIRFNASVLEDPIRIEFNYIPVTRKLVDNQYSIPSVPGNYSKFLVYGAAHFLLLDKSDNKAELYKNLAVAQLQALINDNRKGISLSGINFGRLIPRQGQLGPWGWFRGN